MQCRGGCSGSPSCHSSKCPGGPPRQSRRYKTIENFLRRMAFNLGNSVSQTDVKILSCIPIDVTDLQQRIIELEKELSEAKGNGNGNAKKGRRQSKDKSPRNSMDQGEEMSEGDQEKKEEETKVMMMQMKTPKVEPKPDIGSLPAGPDYMKDYLNVDTKNEVQSLYKAAKKHDKQAEPKLDDAHSTTNTEYVSSHHCVHRPRQRKHNPFTVIMGNVKRRKNDNARFEPKAYHRTSQLEHSGSSYSILIPHSNKRVHKGCPDCKPEDEVGNQINSKPKRRISKKNEKVYPAFAPRNQYVYYAQTNSHFNPDFKNDNYDCDLTYIANLIEKQYTPINLYNEKKLLNRQFSVPVCRDSADILGSKYAISGIGPCSCCPGTTSDVNLLRNEGPIQQKYKEYIHTNINGRFHDSNMYDIIPVKQKATNKHLDADVAFTQKARRAPGKFKPFVDYDPPFNLHPTHSLQMMYDTEQSKNVHSSYSNHPERNLYYSNNPSNKKTHSPRHTKVRYENKTTLDPEDIYMTNKLQPEESSIDDGAGKEIKIVESKPNETVAELKTILQNFLKEIKEDFPKQNEAPSTNDNNVQDIHAQAPIPQQPPYAFVSSFPQILQTPQCCCPVLCPLNFIPDAYKAHPPGLCSLHPNPSDCCIHSSVTKRNNESTFVKDDLSETKKLIKEIYNSISLQNEEKIENNCDIAAEEKDLTKTVTEKNCDNNSKDSKEILECKVHMKNQCVQSVNQMHSVDSTETESKELMRESETNPSSMNTESYVMSIPNVPEMSNNRIKNTKKRKFSNIMQMFKSVSFKKLDDTVKSSESEIKSHFYNERSPFRHNFTHFTATCKGDRTGAFQKMYTNQTINTENPPGDIYKCCYFDKEAERKQSYDHPSTSKPNWSPKHCRKYDEQMCDHNPHRFNNNCFCMPEQQQIPFCLKEIEVKNAGTQSIVKRKKLFAIFKKWKEASDSDSIPSYNHFQPRMPGRHFSTEEMEPGPTEKKNGFWQLLKGEKDFKIDDIYNYNLIDTGKGNVGMKRAQASFFKKPKENKWSAYMQKLEKTKKHDMATHLLNRNPFSIKNIVMRSLMGQKPVANTKTARAFY